MGYDWEGNRDVCFRLYVEEAQPLDALMNYMKDKHNFSPSIRAYQAQFKKWGFPHRQSTPLTNAALVARVRQLWEANCSQADMVTMLNEEGFHINGRSLSRLRAKHKLYMRMPNGVRIANQTGAGKRQYEADSDVDEGPETAEADPVPMDPAIAEPAAGSEQLTEDGRAISPETMARRQQRLEKLQRDSDNLLASKKRRRRTKGWSGLPADAPQPPRFPSETTLDESKAFLHLDNNAYRQLRDDFTRICQEENIERKTLCGPEKWQAAKDRLIESSPHLHNQFHGALDGVPRESKSIALDVICTDNTKRMRTLANRMTINDAKQILGINPKESRDVRQSFYDILRSDHFHSKLEAGDEHWAALKQRWITANPLLQKILNPIEPPDQPTQDRRLKAAETLCRDVMKRLRDEQTRQDPNRSKQASVGPGPGPLRPPNTKATARSDSNASARSSPAKRQSRQPQSPLTPRTPSKTVPIDPNLSLEPPPTIMEQLRHYAATATSTATSPFHPSTQSRPAAIIVASPDRPAAIAAVFRLRPDSTVSTTGPKTWLASLGSSVTPSLADLHRAATAKYADARVVRLIGLVPDLHAASLSASSSNLNESGDGVGGAEAPDAEFVIESDEEVALYLDSCAETGKKASFAVVLASS